MRQACVCYAVCVCARVATVRVLVTRMLMGLYAHVLSIGKQVKNRIKLFVFASNTGI